MQISPKLPFHQALYLAQARTALDIEDWRNALGAARQGLEMLMDRVWRWLGKHELGQIIVAAVQHPPEGEQPPA